jgi:hypothetical protein
LLGKALTKESSRNQVNSPFAQSTALLEQSFHPALYPQLTTTTYPVTISHLCSPDCVRFHIPRQPSCLPPAAPKGFNPVQDLNDNYQFLYPFGWQEVSVGGADLVYKDVIEPLESVSVTITPTDKKDVTEFGDIADVSTGGARKQRQQ